jgi:hypothetical protein
MRLRGRIFVKPQIRVGVAIQMMRDVQRRQILKPNARSVTSYFIIAVVLKNI